MRDRPATTARWLRDWRSIAALVAVAALGSLAVLGRAPREVATDAVSKRYVFLGDSLAPVTAAGRAFALSPDGRDLAYVSGAGPGQLAGLALKRFSTLAPTMIPGSQQAKWPVFSPDGSRLLYVRAFLLTGSLEISSLDGNSTRILVPDSVFVGAAWGDDGYIYYSRLGSLLRIPVNGGTVDTLTTHPDSSQTADRMPVLVPGGHGLFFMRQVGTGPTELMALDLRSHETRRVGTGQPMAIFQDRILLFSTDGVTVQATRFDSDRLTLTGEPVQITPELERNGVAIANVAFSASGSMVYWADVGSATRVYWVDRSGGRQQIDPDWQTPVADSPKLSPDGRRLALAVSSGLVVKQLDRGPASEIIHPLNGHAYLRPKWSPDGRFLLAYQSGIKDSVVVVRDDGLGGLKPTVDDPRGVADATWSPDQQWIVFRTAVEGTNGADIYAVRADGTGGRIPVATSPGSDATPVFSPDGHWLAYVSDESGTFEVYLRPFPNVNDRRIKVSIRGGTQPRWATSSGELFFVGGDNQMMVTRIRTSPSLEVDTPQPLFSTLPFRLLTAVHQVYDVTADGQRFVMIAAGGTPQIIRIDNWLADYPELRK